jgi:hypothetical protein
MPLQRRTSAKPFERTRRYIVIDPDGNKIPFDNPKDAFEYDKQIKESLQPNFKRQLDSLNVVEKNEKINTERQTAPFKTMLDSLNVEAKKMDLKKPFYAPFAPSHTPAVDELANKIATGQASQEEIDRYKVLHPSTATDPEYTDATQIANLSKYLSATVPSIKRNALNPNAVDLSISNPAARQTIQSLINNKVNMRYFKLKADDFKQRGISVAPGKPVSSSADAATLFAKNNAIISEMKAAYQAGKIPVQSKAALVKVINDRMLQETGIPYEEHRQMINDITAQQE